MVLLLSALIIGVGVGAALQRGRGCTNTAFRNLLLIGNKELALMLTVIVSIEVIGYFILSLIPVFAFQVNPIPFSLLFIPLGGFMFGLGTVFAGGCAGGTCYRIGEGSVASLLAFLGFATGIAIIAVGPLAPTVNLIRGQTTWRVAGQTPSLLLILPFWTWAIIAVIVLVLSIGLYRRYQEEGNLQLDHLLPGWTPIRTGLVVGILGILARISSTMAGRPFGLSTTDGIAGIFQSIISFGPLNWAAIFVLGLIFGSGISAVWGDEFSLSVPSSSEVFRFFGGGILLGTGAMLGFGCNFGHIFGGIPELGISSIVSLIFMLMGNWVASYLFYIQMQNPLPQSTPGKPAI